MKMVEANPSGIAFVIFRKGLEFYKRLTDELLKNGEVIHKV
jgi:hypothetical protein